jgi:hypothetical protein
LLTKSAPLHAWQPPRLRWAPDAVAAFLSVLLVGLPQAATLLGQVEVGLTAILMGATAAAPGHAAPHDDAKPTTVAGTAGTRLLVLLLDGLVLGGCAPTLQAAHDQDVAERASRGDGAATPEQDCHRLSRTERFLGWTVKGLAADAAGTAAGSFPDQNRRSQEGLALVSGGLALGAGVAEAVREELASDGAPEFCSHRPTWVPPPPVSPAPRGPLRCGWEEVGDPPDTDLGRGESFPDSNHTGNGNLQAVLGLELSITPRIGWLLECGRWTPVWNDPGDFYRFAHNNVFATGMRFSAPR